MWLLSLIFFIPEKKKWPNRSGIKWRVGEGVAENAKSGEEPRRREKRQSRPDESVEEDRTGWVGVGSWIYILNVG